MSTTQPYNKTFLQLLIRLLFVVAPTIVICYITLIFLNRSFTALNTNVANQALFLGLGLMAAYSLYFYRARFIVTFVLLWLLYWIINRYISRIPGEFDVFNTVVKFKIYSTLFIFGWLFGFLLSSPLSIFGVVILKERRAYIPISAFLACVTIVTNTDPENLDLVFVGKTLIPVLVYTLYMLFVSPTLADSLEMNLKKSGRLILRFVLFLLVSGLMLFLYTVVSDERKAWDNLMSYANGNGKGPGGSDGDKKDGYNEKDGLLERGGKGNKEGQNGKGGKDPKDGSGGNKQDDGEDGYKLKDTMKMSDKMSQSDYVMFCAKLKNFFPDGSPKPLYFVYHYLTKYDSNKECFTRDTAMPSNDEMNADPSALAMFRSKTDSSIIKKCLATKKRSIVEAEVYVSSNTWKHALLAPASAFYCQTIPVDSSYKKMFRAGYRVKCYTSDLNNAYFVYNPSANPQLESYQEERFDALRTVKDYTNTDSAFYVYYTQMPKGPLYDSITALSKRITKDAVTPIDKVIAIRDFFMQRDKEGNHIFRYSLKAGAPSDPNIPNSSMLRNFIFKTHTGYCTYFAGASLFMLRAMGIPARFTTGFATIDRSDKNKGWYWFYASQAHAWTQVYFPGYGWLDFDMTIGNDDQKEAPRPDGTPPLPPPEPWLVMMAKAESAPDLKSKHLTVSFDKIIFFNEQFSLNKTFTRDIDATVCRVLYGKKDTTLACIKAGDSVIVVSYDDAVKKIPQPRQGVSIEKQVEEFPTPVIADEIHVKAPESDDQKQQDKKKDNKTAKKEMTWMQVLLRVGIIVGGVLFLLLLSPWLWLMWLVMRKNSAKDPKTKADRVYRLALYHFHMAGIERGFETPLQYATGKVDPYFGTAFEKFMLVYLRLKYSGGTLMAGDNEIINAFGNSIRSSVRKKKGIGKIFLSYLNLRLADRYFRRPEESDEPMDDKDSGKEKK